MCSGRNRVRAGSSRTARRPLRWLGAGLSFGVAVSIAALASGCSGKPAENDADYARRITEAREHKDRAFANQPNEPIPVDRQKDFLPLSYFPPDPSYAVPATFKAENGPVVDIPTSSGKPRKMQVIGRLEFTLKGQTLALGALVEAGDPPNRLFIPFSDLTSGTETYSAGRYLEIDKSPTGVYVIDFNLAFHPFCYYNHDYDCPYPPPSNRLPIPIRAGEKLRQSNIPAAGHSGK